MTTSRTDPPRGDRGAGGRLPPGDVQRMFDRLVPRYDLLNHVLSLGLDVAWRRAAASRLPRGADLAVADVCCGTGDLAAAVARRLGSRRRVTGLDFSPGMVRRARAKFGRLPGVDFAVGDATRLPLADASVDAVTVAFGLRNVDSLSAALGEMLRVLRPGGQVLVLEFAPPPSGPWRAIFGFYFQHLLPIVGRLVSGHRWAYAYLPASVDRLGGPGPLADGLRAAGAECVAVRRLAGGATVLVEARKPTRG